MWWQKPRNFMARTPPDDRDPHRALKTRIGRTHTRLKQARAQGESPAVVAALTGEVDRALEELHRRLTDDNRKG